MPVVKFREIFLSYQVIVLRTTKNSGYYGENGFD